MSFCWGADAVFNQIFLSSDHKTRVCNPLYKHMHRPCCLLSTSFAYISPSFVVLIQEGTGDHGGSQLDADQAYRSRMKSEFSADSPRLVDSSSGLPRTEKTNDGWNSAMLSIGTFGIREGHRRRSCELSKLQEELKSIVRARGAATADELGRVHHLQLERFLSCSASSKNGRMVRQRSFRKLATRAFGGFLPRPSCRETVPEARFNEIIWGILLKSAHPENSAFTDPVQVVQKDEAEVEDEGGKWIRTDSEYIVLEI